MDVFYAPREEVTLAILPAHILARSFSHIVQLVQNVQLVQITALAPGDDKVIFSKPWTSQLDYLFHLVVKASLDFIVSRSLTEEGVWGSDDIFIY